MPTTYFKATVAGKIEVRSTRTMPYVAAYDGRYGVSWTTKRANVPFGVMWGAAEEITAGEYRAIIKARDVAKAGGEREMKLNKARKALRSAQIDQGYAGHYLPRLAQDGATDALLLYQRRQACAFQRILKARRDIARLEGEGA